MKSFSAAWRLAIGLVGTVLLITLVINVITQPVDVDIASYTADFTDVSGLHPGADVRVRGVRVGKVVSIDLERQSGRSIAEVAFTLDSHYVIGAKSQVAVKYQALTGLRYIDVTGAAKASDGIARVEHIATASTLASFDITKLFNGLQPVLATLSPDDLNVFTSNVENFLTGDGTGLGPVLQSIHTLTQFFADRQQVIAALLQNLRDVAETLSGHAKDLVQVIDWANRPIDAALSILDEFRKSSVYGPDFTRATIQLLDNAGIKPGINIDDALDRALTNFDDTLSAIKFVPVVWDNIPPPGEGDHPLTCSRGRSELPLPIDVLLNGQKVVLCNP